MSIEGHYNELALQVRDLLDCDAVGFLLGCSEPMLRHTLLRLFPLAQADFSGCAGAINFTILADERVRAFCDLAIQSGRVQGGSGLHLDQGSFLIESCLVIPLERQAGVLGFFLAVDRRPVAFSAAQRILVNNYRQIVASWLEQQLPRLVAFPTIRVSAPENRRSGSVVIERPVPDQFETKIQNQMSQLLREKHQLEEHQRTIASEKSRIETVLAGIADGIIVLDVVAQPVPTLIVSGWNRAAVRYTGIEIKDALGRGLSDLLPWQDEVGHTLEELAYQVLAPRRGSLGDGALQRDFCVPDLSRPNEPDQRASGKPVLSDILYGKQKRDSARWISIHASAVTTERGRATSLRQVIFGLRDVSQQKELERLKNEFLSMVSHELRTPLTAIKGYTGLLQSYSTNDEEAKPVDDEEMTPARQQQYLDIIMEQTSQLEVLISDLLDVSRIQNGRLTLRPTSMNVALLCQRVVQMIQKRERMKAREKYQFRCTFAPDLPQIWADPHRVQQIVTNLLENAIKYSPHGGLIEVIISARRAFQGLQAALGKGEELPESRNGGKPGLVPSPMMVHVTIRDQGIGIARQQQGRLFKPFSRLEHPLTAEVQGAGLGLYITRKLVEAMGGGVILRSSEGNGTSVTFTLPVVQAEELVVGAGTVNDTPREVSQPILEKKATPVSES